jgi:putative flippase GtrA
VSRADNLFSKYRISTRRWKESVANRHFRGAPDTQITKQILRYGTVAATGYLFAIALYSGELAVGVTPYTALGIAFILNGLYNFVLMRLWVFPSTRRPAHRDLARFGAVATLSLTVNYASFGALYSLIGLHPATAQRIAILIAAPVTFVANRQWSFRAPHPNLQTSTAC